MKNPIDLIPFSDDVSEGQMIFRQWRAGKITDEQYFLYNAQLAYALLDQERVIRYPALDRDLEQYVSGRMIGAEFNRQTGIRLGAWIEFVVRSMNENVAIRDHLTWCLGKVEKANLATEAAAFRKRIDEINRNAPPAMIEKALTVQKRDAVAREMEARGRQ